MRYKTFILSVAAAALTAATPAFAQTRSTGTVGANSTRLAQQVTASGDQPDVILDVPNLKVGELTIEVAKLHANISLSAELASLLRLNAGADVGIDQVKIQLKDVQATATLVVRLDNVKAIIDRTLQTVDKNPNLLNNVLSSVNNTVGTVGGVANNALGTVGGVTNNALGTVGGIAGNVLQRGQVLDLAGAGLTQLSRTAGSNGQTVIRARDGAGQLLNIVVDSANRILSSNRVSG